MEKGASLLLLVAGLSACQPAAEAPSVPIEPAAPIAVEVPAPAAVRDLAGHWRVAAIDGREMDQSVALALTGDAVQIWWEPRCAGMARNYAISGSTIRFTSTYPPRAPGEATPPVCAIGLPPRLDEVFRALDGARTVERTAQNGILIAGPAHSVTIFSQ